MLRVDALRELLRHRVRQTIEAHLAVERLTRLVKRHEGFEPDVLFHDPALRQGVLDRHAQLVRREWLEKEASRTGAQGVDR